MNVCESCPLINIEDCRKDCNIIKQAKKEAREEFAEKILTIYKPIDNIDNKIVKAMRYDIDKLLKEYEEAE